MDKELEKEELLTEDNINEDAQAYEGIPSEEAEEDIKEELKGAILPLPFNTHFGIDFTVGWFEGLLYVVSQLNMLVGDLTADAKKNLIESKAITPEAMKAHEQINMTPEKLINSVKNEMPEEVEEMSSLDAIKTIAEMVTSAKKKK